MNDDQRKALSMALEYSFSEGKREPANGVDGKQVVLRAVDRATWPEDGFAKLAQEIVSRAITNDWPRQVVKQWESDRTPHQLSAC
jgi:hypothetical protein